jgi:undecaprenyl-diphosphatase
MALRAHTPASRRRSGRLSVRQAVVLGLIQGPAEVLPVSSSGHLVLVPALLHWPYAQLPADVRKTFEVALHTGAGLALAWLLRDDLIAAIRDPAGTALLAAPASAVALALEDRIEQRASDPALAGVAMVAGGIALWATDSATNPPKGVRPPLPGALAGREGVRPLSQAFVGVAQAAALVPGVSRNGATVTAARALGFDREAAARLSWRAGLPIIGGATALKLARLAQRGLAPELRAPFAAGAAAAFVSTLAASPLLRVRRQRATAAYRVAFGTFALRRLHRLEWPRD